MKNLLLAAILTFVAGSAQAAPIFCTTNIDQNPRQTSTNITITPAGPGLASVRQQTNGGMAHFVTAPRIFDVAVKHIGPEVAKYTNAEENFELVISFQRLGGSIRGTLNTLVFGQKLEAPVSCVAAQD